MPSYVARKLQAAAAALSSAASSAAEAFADAAASAGMGGQSAEEAFVRGEKNKWAPERRPCEHPYDCDFRVALGLPLGLEFTRTDVLKNFRQASRWWHPDQGGSKDAYQCFLEIKNTFINRELRKAYASQVDNERELAHKFGTEVNWRFFNQRFLMNTGRRARVFPRGTMLQVGSKVCIGGLQSAAELNGLEGTCKLWDAAKGRWNVQLEQGDVKALKPENLELASSTATPSPEQDEGGSMLFVFLDGSKSMSGARLAAAKRALADVYPRFVGTPTAVHMIGSKTGHRASRLVFSGSEELEHKEAQVMGSWKTDARGTYLWQYVYEQTKDFAELNHEIIIITDGMDDESEKPFDGILGFNELMRRMGGKRIRISLLLIGKRLPADQATKYRDLCMASGGVYHHARIGDEHALVTREFVAPLLLPDAERDILALHQQTEYQEMLDNGMATPFDWYVALAEGEPGASSARAPFRPAARVHRINGQVTVEEISASR